MATLNICQLSTGVLYATGGDGGAGVGGSVNENPGNIFVSGGQVIAKGTGGGAAIGSGRMDEDNNNIKCGRVALYNGGIVAEYDGDGEQGLSAGAAIGSANTYLRMYVYDDYYLVATENERVVRTDADGNFSMTATVYNGNANGEEMELSPATPLTGNAIAFTDNGALVHLMDNVVLRDADADGNTCRRLNLIAGEPFYTPADFTAESVQYTIDTDDNFTYADGTNGWHTLCLPFSGTFYADDEAVTPFASADDMDGTFWLKTFSGQANGDVLGFGFATTVEAGVPYIYAIPGDAWGEEHSMMDKTISVRATDATVGMTLTNASGDGYVFEGSFTGSDKSDCYVLNENGNAFEQKTLTTCKPFEAVITTTNSEAKGTLFIGDVTPTGILRPNASIDKQSDVPLYDLSGRRLQTARPGSIYIKNNRKYIK